MASRPLKPKPRFQFYFADAPHRAVYEDRDKIARLLRSYRRQPKYRLLKVGTHSYIVRYGDAIGCIGV